MEQQLYPMIFKRKSFHLFRNTGTIDDWELRQIEAQFKTFTPLVEEIRVDLKIVPATRTTCKRGEEYCVLLYSERKEHYLQNIGYIGQQLDLYLASMNIGALWFGIGKTEEETYNGLDFVIMIAIAKMPGDKFRKDMFKSKRKPLDEIWQGEAHLDAANIARFAPSACNTQPWMVESRGDTLAVYRYQKPGKRGIMPADMVTYYNRIDMGIFLLFLELCLKHTGHGFERTLYSDRGDAEKTLTAVYQIHEGCLDLEKIRLELLDETNLDAVRAIDREDVSEAFVDSVDTIMEITRYGLDHHCLGHTYAIRYEETYVGVILMGEAIPWETDPQEMRGVPYYRLMGFVLDRRYRNGGIGGHVLETVIRRIYGEYGPRPIALGVHRDNHAAARFYQKHGFRKTQAMEGTDCYFLREVGPHDQ